MLRHERQPVREFPFVHVEAADDSSRGLATLMQAPAADIGVGAVMIVRADKGTLIVPGSAGAGERDAACIVIGRIGASLPNARDTRVFPIRLPILARDAEVIGSRLIWPADITADGKAALIAQLGAVGLIVV